MWNISPHDQSKVDLSTIETILVETPEQTTSSIDKEIWEWDMNIDAVLRLTFHRIFWQVQELVL